MTNAFWTNYRSLKQRFIISWADTRKMGIREFIWGMSRGAEKFVRNGNAGQTCLRLKVESFENLKSLKAFTELQSIWLNYISCNKSFEASLPNFLAAFYDSLKIWDNVENKYNQRTLITCSPSHPTRFIFKTF